MIKITETVAGQTKSTLFSEETLIIGDSQSAGVHLPFSGRGLKAEHVKIYKQNEAVWVQNVANDPFVTLNNQPFFKKKALPGDVIRIRDVELKIEEIASESSQVKKEPPKKVEPAPSLPVEDVNESEEIIHAPMRNRKEPFVRPSLKDYDLPVEKEIFDSEEGKKTAEKHEAQRSWSAHLNVSPFRSVRLFSFFVMGLFLISAVIGVEFYLRASEKSDEDELKAAESISDIAMGLTYAQLYHISPVKHNWSDPEFIQNNLLATLPAGSPSEVKLNSQGEFGNCDYILRVYTSNDLSRFLVVAHPNPSLLQWLIPRSALIVDSSTMEIRRIRDLKGMNRLLSTLNTLDGINVAQITDFVKKAEIIPLAHLAKAVKKPEFAPPKLLAAIRPGAENLIYNAPRYHPFGDALLKKAEYFSSTQTSSHELAMFQSELEMLKRLKNLVLYTTDNSEAGTFALDGLKMIAPDKKYILASIKYDAKGRFRSTQIIMDSDHERKPELLATEETAKPYVDEIHVFEIGPFFEEEPEIVFEEEEPDPIPDLPKSPLLMRLEAIAENRDQRLKRLEKILLHDVKNYLATLNQKKLLLRLKRVAAKREAIDLETKEDLYDLAFDAGEAESGNLREWVNQTKLSDLYDEAIHGK